MAGRYPMMHMLIKAVPTPAVTLIAICGKCGKARRRLGPSGNDGLGKALGKALHLPKPKRAKVRIVETKCLKLCPKGAVAVVNGNDPGHILVVPEGMPVSTIIHRMGLHTHP